VSEKQKAELVKVPTVSDVRKFINDYPDVGRWIYEMEKAADKEARRRVG
jgi:hypothetical protein